MSSYLVPNNRIMKLRIALIAAAVLPLVIMGTQFAQADNAPSPSGSPMPVANFTVRCPFSHSANLDPIVMPGMVGMGHQHEFFGNTSTNENSTTQSLLAAPTTCAKVGQFTDVNDHSAYWVPSLYQYGKRIAPTAVYASYSQLSGLNGSVSPFPNGFKAVTGRSSQSVVWGCTSIDTQSLFTKAIEDVPTCQSPQHLFARVSFANCWTGLSTDSSDHASHLEMQYRVGGRMQCPSTHQIKVPLLTLNVQYPVASITNDGASLASGPPSSMHADMFEAWTNDGLTKRMSGN
jgi:hypothetical protein